MIAITDGPLLTMEEIMIRCSECKKPIIETTKYQDWLSLLNFFEFLYNEEYIEESTYLAMIDRLMTLKQFAFEDCGDC